MVVAFSPERREVSVKGSVMTAQPESQARAESHGRDAGEARGDMLDLAALWAAIKHRKFWIIAPPV